MNKWSSQQVALLKYKLVFTIDILGGHKHSVFVAENQRLERAPDPLMGITFPIHLKLTTSWPFN